MKKSKNSRPPAGYRDDPEWQELYEDVGRSVGRMLNYFPEREGELWKTFKCVPGWKRWYLPSFKASWRRENETEARVARKKVAKRRVSGM